MRYTVCDGCKAQQIKDLHFNAKHPITRRIIRVEYCAEIDCVLDSKVKKAMTKLNCNRGDLK